MPARAPSRAPRAPEAPRTSDELCASTLGLPPSASLPRPPSACRSSSVKEVFSFAPHVPASLKGSGTFARGGISKISQHFKGALEATLTKRGHSHAVMIEDDLLLSPDFLRLFWSSAWLLQVPNAASVHPSSSPPHRLLSASRSPEECRLDCLFCSVPPAPPLCLSRPSRVAGGPLPLVCLRME